MRKIVFSQFVLGAVVLPAWTIFAQANPPAPTTPPAQAAAPMDQEIPAIPLRALPVVQDVRERSTPWQQAADQAVARISEPQLKSSVSGQLARVAPQVAGALMTRPGDSAIVTIAVYHAKDNPRQSAAAVAFEGLGDALNPSFFPRVLANFPQPPQGNNIPQPLELDAGATSYLCFFLDHGDLKAGNISDEQMKRSLSVAIERARRDSSASGAAGAVATQPPAPLAQQPANVPAPANTPPGSETPQSGADLSPQYTYPYWADNTGSVGTDYWIPWFTYYPAYGQQPIVVEPDYRHRHHFRDRDGDHDRAGLSQGGASTPTPPMTTAQTPPVPRPVIPPRPIDNRPAGPIDHSVGRLREPARAEPAAAHLPAAAEPAPAREAPAREAPADRAPAHEQPAPAHAEPAPAHAEPPPPHAEPAPAPAHAEPAGHAESAAHAEPAPVHGEGAPAPHGGGGAPVPAAHEAPAAGHK